MIMRFYKTGYNLNNRAYNYTSLQNICKPTNSQTYVTNIQTDDTYVYPEALPVSAGQGINIINGQADYAVFTDNNNKTYYAFITEILVNPVNNGYMIYFQTDIWATYALGQAFGTPPIDIYNVEIRGNLLQAHVNDWENGKPTLRYTTPDTEYEILKDGIEFKRKNIFVDTGLKNRRYKCLYVLCNTGNKNALIDFQRIENSYYTPDGEKINTITANQYMLFICPIDTETYKLGSVTFYNPSTGTYNPTPQLKDVYLKDLDIVAGIDTEQGGVGIVNMWISDILPYGDYISTNSNGETENILVHIIDTSYGSSYFDSSGSLYSNTARLLQTPYLKLYNNLAVGVETLESFIRYTNQTNLLSTYYNNYENYISKGIVKVRTNTYNPVAIYFDGTTVLLDYFEITTPILINIDPLLLYVSINSSTTIKKYLSANTEIPIYCHYEPLQHQSYWTRLDAKQSTIEANRSKVIGELKFASNIIGYAGNTASTFTGLSRTASTPLGKKQTQLNKNLNVAGGAIGAGTDVITGALDLAVDGINLKTLHERANIIIEKNNALLQNGLYQEGSFSQSGQFLMSSGFYAISASLTPYCYNKISEEMHVYGYQTFIPLTNDYFKTHERQSFNFILAESVIVSGLPLQYCRDIEAMFENGVTLWKTQPMNYKVVNIPVNHG